MIFLIIEALRGDRKRAGQKIQSEGDFRIVPSRTDKQGIKLDQERCRKQFRSIEQKHIILFSLDGHLEMQARRRCGERVGGNVLLSRRTIHDRDGDFKIYNVVMTSR